jgi:hypothetical protein
MERRAATIHCYSHAPKTCWDNRNRSVPMPMASLGTCMHAADHDALLGLEESIGLFVKLC